MKAPKLLVIFNNKAPIICILLGLLIFFSGLLMVFDIIPDSLIYRLSLFARDGKINDINDVMISLIAFGKMLLVLGLTILIFGIIFLYLTNNIEENHIDTLFDEREKYPDPRNPGTFYKHKMDMENIKRYGKLEFMDAAEELGMFGKSEFKNED